MTRKLTKVELEKYRKADGRCPVCHSKEVDEGYYEFPKQDFRCRGCKTIWRETFKSVLSSVTIDPPIE